MQLEEVHVRCAGLTTTALLLTLGQEGTDTIAMMEKKTKMRGRRTIGHASIELLSVKRRIPAQSLESNELVVPISMEFYICVFSDDFV